MLPYHGTLRLEYELPYCEWKMKWMWIGLTVLLSILMPGRLRAGDSLCVGTRYTLYSELLGEEREYWVYCPPTADGRPQSGCPVLYLLDGDSFFTSVVGFTQFFSRSRVAAFPPCAVVAVLNTDRTRDLTPTCSAVRRDGSVHAGDRPQGGGAERFARFLVEELRPAVERTVMSNGQNYLVGHSYAGLFTLYALSTRPGAFQTYVALDPSLWWDGGKLLQQLEQPSGTADVLSGRKLYVAFATQARADRPEMDFSRADTLEQRVFPVLRERGMETVCRRFSDETHGTIALPGIFDGLKRLFSR